MSKQNQIIAAAIIAIIIAVGVAFFVITHRSTPNTQPIAADNSKASTPDATVASEGTFNSLLALNKNVKCDVTYNTEDVANSGSVYLAGKKMRGDFSAVVSGKTVSNHMISDGTYIYSWSEGQAQGVKMKIEAGSPSPAAGQSNSQSVNLNQNVKYNCSNWNVDESKFTVPTDIKFTDLSEMMKGTGSVNSSPTSNSASSYCDSISDPQAKAACISATSK